MTRKPYKKTKLILHGDIKSLTRGFQKGDYTDADFPRGTPNDDLTFTVTR